MIIKLIKSEERIKVVNIYSSFPALHYLLKKSNQVLNHLLNFVMLFLNYTLYSYRYLLCRGLRHNG